MTQTAINYAKALYSAGVDGKDVLNLKETFLSCPELLENLSAPVVSESEKFSVIDELFNGKTANLVKIMCENKCISQIVSVCDAFDKIEKEKSNCANIRIVCTTPPSEEQIEKIKKFICKKHGVKRAEVTVENDRSILGGFVIYYGDIKYDRSLKNRLELLKQNLVGEVN